MTADLARDNMSRFFTSPDMVGDDIITLDDSNDLHHMHRVLRLSAGDKIDVSDGETWEYRAEIISLTPDLCRARILDKQKFSREPELRITLFQGIPKQGKMETIVQKSVELGVYRIVPVFMVRTVVSDKGNIKKKLERWRRTSAEAVKQCRRGIIPQVEEPVGVTSMIGEFGKFDLVLFPYENEEGVTIKDVLRSGARPEAGVPQVDEWRDVAVVIGPEGGFADSEAEAIMEAGGRSVSLGKTTLRTETAGMTAIAMIMYELEL